MALGIYAYTCERVQKNLWVANLKMFTQVSSPRAIITPSKITSSMPEILIHYLPIVVHVGDMKRPLSRNVKLAKLWAVNPEQRI
jgi:hypothetical protein